MRTHIRRSPIEGKDEYALQNEVQREKSDFHSLDITIKTGITEKIEISS
jgi:hypothetical protein